MNAHSGQMTDNGTYPERAAAQGAAQQTFWQSCAKRIERVLVDLPQKVAPRAGRKKQVLATRLIAGALRW